MSKRLSQPCFDKVKTFFGGDNDRTWMWFKTPNPNLGMVSPLDMIRAGRTNKLAEFIDSALDGNRRL